MVTQSYFPSNATENSLLVTRYIVFKQSQVKAYTTLKEVIFIH